MKANNKTSSERVVKIVETCDGSVVRVFYCIHDPDFGHWMSREPFDGLIWTKDVACRREFASRREAKAELIELQDWREEREHAGETSGEREAA